MTRFKRRPIVLGQYHEIECAVRADMSCPAGEFFDALKTGTWEPDPDADSLPDEDQIGDYAWLLNALTYFARHGEPQYRGAVNYLRSGIWEFKRASKRLSFYDTDGDGGCVEKPKLKDRNDSPNPDSDCWHIPDFDLLIRLGHAFPKLGQNTATYDLEDAEDVREEDLEHDRQQHKSV